MENGFINVVDPQTQEMGSIPAEQAQEAFSQGYQQASPEQVQTFKNQEHYGSLPQQALTGVEGALSGASLGLSRAGELGLSKLGVPGLSAEEQRGREEANPTTSTLGKIGGFGAGLALTGGANAIEGLAARGVGAAATEAAGMGVAQKIGSAAIRGAIETSIYQGQDEAAKAILQDPSQTLGSAVSSIGLSGALGGLTGGALTGAGLATKGLWNATAGPTVSKFMNMLASKTGGVEGIPGDLADTIKAAGVDISPEVKSALSDHPILQQAAKTLEQTDTNSSGLEYQKSLNTFKKNAGDSILQALGKTPEEVANLGELSKYESGKEIGHQLASELEERVGPLSNKFEEIKEKFKDVPLNPDVQLPDPRNPYVMTTKPGTLSQAAENIAQLVQKEGWGTSQDSEIMKAVNSTLKELPQQKTLGDLNNFITQVGNNTYDFTNPQLTRAGMMIKGALKDVEGNMVVDKLAQESPELLADHAAARSEWKALSDLKDSLDSRLHVKGGSSLGSFVRNLKDMSQENGEKVLQRLSGKGDANLLATLEEHFPQTAQALKNFHLSEVLQKAAAKAGPDQSISSRVLISALDKMSPELKGFVVPEGALPQINAVNDLLGKLESVPHNFSNTARTMDKLIGYVPGSAMGLMTMMVSHNPAAALVVGGLTKMLGKDIPDATRLAMLKWMGSGAPINAGAFYDMAHFFSNAISGERLATKVVKDVFRMGAEVGTSKLYPSEKKLDQLDAQASHLQDNPQKLQEIPGQLDHYLPDVVQAHAQMKMSAMEVINSMRPKSPKNGMLDGDKPVSKGSQMAFRSILAMTEQPLLAVQKMKDGTLTSQDVSLLKTVYPGLYASLSMKIMNQLSSALEQKKTIPLKTKQSLSLFLGQPLDSLYTPQAIQSNQATFLVNPKLPSEQRAQQKIDKVPTNSFKKVASMDQTPLQHRQANRK